MVTTPNTPTRTDRECGVEVITVRMEVGWRRENSFIGVVVK